MNIEKSKKAPLPGKVLFESIFANKREKIINIISNGLSAVINNAERLLDDVEYLSVSKRFASATFLLTTAREEIAKAYILLDMGRLDFEEHQSVLRKLCSCFYDHVMKYVYLKINNSYIHNMYHAKKLWEHYTTKWFPSNGDLENYEPDMPHDIVFMREYPLYVNKSEFGQNWYVPNNEDFEWRFQGFKNESAEWTLFADSIKIFKQLKHTYELGLLGSNYINNFNQEFKTHYISDRTDDTQTKKIYKKIFEIFEKVTDICEEDFWKTELVKYPLYHFVTKNYQPD